MAKKQSKLTPALEKAQASRKIESARRSKLTPDQRFKEDAEKKISIAISAVSSLGRMPSRRTDAEGNLYFNWTPPMIEKMFGALRTSVDLAESRYLVKQEGKKKRGEGFSF